MFSFTRNHLFQQETRTHSIVPWIGSHGLFLLRGDRLFVAAARV